MLKVYPQISTNSEFNHKDNNIRLGYARILHLMLSETDVGIDESIVLIAWCLIVLNGLLSYDGFLVLSQLQQEPLDLDALPWHSESNSEKIKWIPDVVLFHGRNEIMRLKLFLNYFFCALFKHKFGSQHQSPLQRLSDCKISCNAVAHRTARA